MRLIAGKWRGNRIEWPRHGGTRPMPDRVRESIFNILGSRFGNPGTLPLLKVADLFAGSGSLGLEALSRGAQSCDFFEHARPALTVLRGNLSKLKIGAEARIHESNVWRMNLSHDPPDGYELVFLDPPYKDARDMSPGSVLMGLLRRLELGTSKDAILVLHHEKTVSCPENLRGGWTVADMREFGTHAVTFIEKV